MDTDSLPFLRRLHFGKCPVGEAHRPAVISEMWDKALMAELLYRKHEQYREAFGVEQKIKNQLGGKNAGS